MPLAGRLPRRPGRDPLPARPRRQPDGHAIVSRAQGAQLDRRTSRRIVENAAWTGQDITVRGPVCLGHGQTHRGQSLAGSERAGYGREVAQPLGERRSATVRRREPFATSKLDRSVQ